MYVVLEESSGTRKLDGGYTVFGQVISGMDVVRKIQEGDMIKQMSVRSEPAAE